MDHDYTIANLNDPGVLEIVQAILTPEDRVAAWAAMQYRHTVMLVEQDEHNPTYLHIQREDDIEPTIALLAEAGVFLRAYAPYVGEGWV